MKANAPKRKVFQDALDLLAEDPVKNMPVAVNGIVSIPVEEIHPFHDHPFRLYEGDRLEDMVQSIREYGVLNPVIVRKAARGYEMLAGHNRTNAAKIAGLTEVPAIVKTDLSDEDAYVYVIETNLLQRSFAELLPSEKAAVLMARYEKISSQGNEMISGRRLRLWKKLVDTMSTSPEREPVDMMSTSHRKAVMGLVRNME